MNKEIAIDLGTANTVIIYNDKVVVDEPSIVAIQRDTKKIIAVGKKAMMMHGKTHENIKTIRPLSNRLLSKILCAAIYKLSPCEIASRSEVNPPAFLQ